MYSKDYEDLCKRVEAIDKKAAEYMRGDARKMRSFYENKDISVCFLWRHTPQGWQYWNNIDDILNGCTELPNEIKRHKTRLSMSQAELSKAIGKSKNYLSEMVNRGCSKEKELEIIAMLNDLKSDDEIIAELSQKLADVQDECVVLRSERSELDFILDDSQRKLENTSAELDRTKVMMNVYFIIAMILGALLGVFWG